MIRYYTREAGVRELERQLAKLCCKVIRERLGKDSKTPGVAVNESLPEDYNGYGSTTSAGRKKQIRSAR